MNISDEKFKDNWKVLEEGEGGSKEERIIATRRKRKGYENFCDMLSCMTGEELKELYLKKRREFDNPDLTSAEQVRIHGEIIRIIKEYRKPNRTVKTNNNDRWYEDCAFGVSYGVDGGIIPVGDIVTFQKLELYNGSLDIQEYLKLSDEDKKKTVEAVFSNEKGNLKLRIPIGSLMELRDILEEYATGELVDDAEIPSLSSLSLDDMGATIESIDINGKPTGTLLGTNYSIYPLGNDNERIRKRERDTSDAPDNIHIMNLYNKKRDTSDDLER